jgi:hypothetical protein
MMSDDMPQKPKSQLMKLVLPIIAGCLLSCCLSVLINNFQYGKKVVKLDKNLDNYKDEDAIPYVEATDVNMVQSLKWSIIPAIFNLIVWAGIIWLITKTPKVSNETEDTL